MTFDERRSILIKVKKVRNKSFAAEDDLEIPKFLLRKDVPFNEMKEEIKVSKVDENIQLYPSLDIPDIWKGYNLNGKEFLGMGGEPSINTDYRYEQEAIDQLHTVEEKKDSKDVANKSAMSSDWSWYNKIYYGVDAFKFVVEYLTGIKHPSAKLISQIDISKINRKYVYWYMARMKSRNCKFNDNYEIEFSKYISYLEEEAKKQSDLKKETQQTKVYKDTVTPRLLADIEGMFDDILYNDRKKEELESLILVENWPKYALDKMVEHYKNGRPGIEDDLQYMKSNTKEFSKDSINKASLLLELYDVILKTAETKSQNITRVNTTVNKNTNNPAVAQVKSVELTAMDKDTGIASLPATKMVNAQTIVFYNVNNRKLTIFHALPGKKFEVKGKSLINHDPERSVTKIMSYPKRDLPALSKANKKEFEKLFAENKNTAAKMKHASILREHIILKIF